MPKLNIPIDGGFYESDSLPISAQTCINWYVNVPQTQGSLTAGNLNGCAGISQIQTTGTINQVNRGMHVKAGRPYFLNGENLVRIDRAVDSFGGESFSIVQLGVIPGLSRVSMADNGTQLMVLVPGGDGYIIDESSNDPFLQISDLGFTANGAPQMVVFVDSFFVVSTDNKRFIRSDANNGLSWNALNVFSAESDPDDIVGLTVFNNKLFVLGSEVTEEFQDLGGVFQRTGLFIPKGLFAPFSVVSVSNSFMWIGGGTDESPAIWMMSGNTPQKVSTTAIDSALQDFSQEDIQTSFSYSYAQNGQYFVGFSLPRRTFEYNTINGKWNERTSQVLNTKGLLEVIRWRVNSLATAYNRVLCGDSQDGRIGSIEESIYTEYDENILREVVTSPLSNLGNAILVSSMEATFEGGVGDFENEDPQVRMSVSMDSKTFNNELPRGIGKIGEYYRRAIWYRLGRFPRWALFKFEFSEKVKPTFIKLEASIKGGLSGN